LSDLPPTHPIVKMSTITVQNNTSVTIWVSITATGADTGNGGDENWFTVQPNGGSETWGERSTPQIVRYVKSYNAGAVVESVLGVPGDTVSIY
jgi:hypothetical protein